MTDAAQRIGWLSLGLVLAVAALPRMAHGQAEVTKDAPKPVTSKYSFEGPPHWVPQDYEDSLACTDVSRSKKKVKEGYFSLKMKMDLVGEDAKRSKGEAWVDMQAHPPQGKEKAPFDLTNQTITVWVYAPRGASGNWLKRNGFQIFVKDEQYNNEYGTWHNITEEEKWVKISMDVSASEPEGGYMNPGFRPDKIMALGVKMGAGGGSTATYKGPVYIDAVNWEPTR